VKANGGSEAVPNGNTMAGAREYNEIEGKAVDFERRVS